MQLSPNVEFWLRVAAIGVPAISAIIVAAVSYGFSRRMANRQKELSKELALYQSGLQTSLNKELENYKKDISKELEIHRLQLQSDFQTRFYEFQTRYSWLHQKRAEAIVELYGKLARVHTDLQVWSAPGTRHLPKPANEFYKDAQTHLTEMTNFFDEKRILFHEEVIAIRVIEMVSKTRLLYDQHPDIEQAKGYSAEFAEFLKQNSYEMISEYVNPLMALLRRELLKLLEAEKPGSNLVQAGPARSSPSPASAPER